eukprot:scaffold769_cov278-Pavlova_lutheri.AAC.5
MVQSLAPHRIRVRSAFGSPFVAIAPPVKVVVVGPHSTTRNRACFRAMDHAWTPANAVHPMQGLQVVAKDGLELWDVTGSARRDGMWTGYVLGASTVVVAVPAQTTESATRAVVREYEAAAKKAARESNTRAVVRVLLFDESEPASSVESKIRRLLPRA